MTNKKVANNFSDIKKEEHTFHLFNVESSCQGLRLDIFLLQKLPDLTRSHIKNLIDDGMVTINGKVKKAGEKLKENENISVVIPKVVSMEATAEDIDIEIVFENEDFLIVNKKQGMVVHPAAGNRSGTLVNSLLFNVKNLSGINGVIRPGIVHRLDKDTSGLLIVAKNDFAHNILSKQIQNKTCHRYYKALVFGNLKEKSGEIATNIGRNPKDRKQMAVVGENEGKKAITKFRVIEEFIGYSLVEFDLKTGRTHQIRVHCKYLGHPIVGDLVYGRADKQFKLNGQLLHAYKLILNDPRTDEERKFESNLPNYFEEVLTKLRNVKNSRQN